MRNSIYLEGYLNAVAAGLNWTPGTYLHYQLRGVAKDWEARYYRQLMGALHDRWMVGELTMIKSTRGGFAYIRIGDKTE